MSNTPHRSALRYGRISIPGNAYFITKCALDRTTKLLSEPMIAELIIQSFVWIQEQNWAEIAGFVIMPNHYHVTFGLCGARTLSQIMESVGKYTSRQINKTLGIEGRFWEEGFYDHGIRDRSDFDGILTYMHENPVRAGLVASPEMWPFSTANPKYVHLINWEWIGSGVSEGHHF